MPFFIPIILGIAAAAAGTAGVVKGVEGVSDTNRAKEIAENAEKRHKKAISRFNEFNDEVRDTVIAYAELQQETINTTQRVFINYWKKLNPQIRAKITSKPVSGDIPFVVSSNNMQFMEKQITQVDNLKHASSAAAAGISAALTGGATASAIGLAGMVGATASTGAAIGGLSGVAATNATLAWIGGGALAAGGGGMALGTAVLGGLVAAPAFLIGGFAIAAAGEKKLTEAWEYDAEIDKKVAKIEAGMDRLKYIEEYVRQNREVFEKLKQRSDTELSTLMNSWYFVFCKEHDDDLVRSFRRAATLCRALSEMIKNPPLDSKMNIVPENVDLEELSRLLLTN